MISKFLATLTFVLLNFLCDLELVFSSEFNFSFDCVQLKRKIRQKNAIKTFVKELVVKFLVASRIKSIFENIETLIFLKINIKKTIPMFFLKNK